jgi:hypothetical protein
VRGSLVGGGRLNRAVGPLEELCLREKFGGNLSCLSSCSSIPVSLVREPSLSSCIVLDYTSACSRDFVCFRLSASHLSLRTSEPSWPPLAWTFFTHGNSSHEAAANIVTSANAVCHRAARSICISASRSSHAKSSKRRFRSF